MTDRVDFVALTREYVFRNQAMGEHIFCWRGREYVVRKSVFSPYVFEDTAFFLRSLPVRRGERVLEVGCGAGVLAVEAALAGAGSVIAIDINPCAVENTRVNAARHGVAHRVTCHAGDLFSALEESLRFDVIFWNAPFVCADAPDLGALEAGQPLPIYGPRR